MPQGYDCNANHLYKGAIVAITRKGLEEHNNYHLGGQLALGAGVGALALPVLFGGGVGLVFGGEAMGLAVGELAVIGGMAGGAATKSVTRPTRGHSGSVENVTLINMIGRVKRIETRWFAEGADAVIEWEALDEDGNRVNTTSYHDPDRLVRLAVRK